MDAIRNLVFQPPSEILTRALLAALRDFVNVPQVERLIYDIVKAHMECTDCRIAEYERLAVEQASLTPTMKVKW